MAKRSPSILIIFFIAAMALAGCACLNAPKGLSPFQPQAPESGTAKVEQFVVVLDASESMNACVKEQGRTRFQIARDLVNRLNQTLPELGYRAGLRTYGHSPKFSDQLTELIYGMSAYNRDEFAAALQKINIAGGTSPMASALASVNQDLQGAEGRTAVIVVSDGDRIDKAALAEAKALKEAFGDRLCIYPVWVPNVEQGRDFMAQLALAGGCGFTESAADLSSAEAVSDYVKKVFLEAGMAPAAPEQPAAVAPVPAAPAVVGDADGDGVPDDRDQCPNTPKGARVDERGCWVISGPFFDFDRYNVKPEFAPVLDEVVDVLNQNPGLKIEIQGHTDSIGTEQYNQRLSERRANSVKAYLVSKGIAPERMVTVGFGESRPALPNDTPEARAKNRRVEFAIAQ